jgi:trehalose 6-phosphate phosphatase
VNLGEARVRIANALQNRQRILLCLDFDGTLAPIQSDPATVALPELILATLDSLRRDPRVEVAIISGRSLQDLKRRIPLPLVFAGNHGLEIRGRGLQYMDQRAESATARLKALVTDLNLKLRHIPGMLIENKGLTASVHFRNVARRDVPEIASAVRTSILPVANVFDIREGNEVLEILPHVGRSKGIAARYILDSMGGSDVLTVCIGDDVTDEDMFTAMSSGITIRVGLDAPTSAHCQVAGVEDVTAFLDCILRMLKERPANVRGAV